MQLNLTTDIRITIKLYAILIIIEYSTGWNPDKLIKFPPAKIKFAFTNVKIL